MTISPSTMFEQAEQRLDQETNWIRLENEGDQFVMVVDTFTIANGQYGPYPVVAGTLKDGTPAVFSGGRAALKAKLTENPPAKGDVLSVRYLGERVSEKSGRTYHAYKTVLVDGGGPRPTNGTTAVEATEDW